MKKVIFYISTIFTMTVFLASCQKDSIKCTDDQAFCELIEKQAFDNTSDIINQFLKKQKSTLSDEEKLDQLKEWLTCKSCVTEAQIICVSCIETLPTQSPLKVVFDVQGQAVQRILDISMEKPLKFRAFHE